MHITVYNGEKFERSSRRYIIASTVFAVIIVLSLITGNIAGAVLLFLFLGWYLYYWFVDTNKLVSLTIQTDGLIIHKKLYPRSTVQQFSLEVDTRTQALHNIILQLGWYHMIYTFADTPENITAFIADLQWFIPMADAVQETFLEKVTRRLKL